MVTKLPIGIQSFEDIRTSGYKYIDKTERVFQLTHYHKHVFLSRPRRFGKSLLVSTLEAYFLGKKELFKGLAIEGLEKEWLECPVLRLDLNSGDYTDPKGLTEILHQTMAEWESKFELEQLSESVSLRFIDIIKSIHKKTEKKVVVLVDEYDKPLISTLSQPELQSKLRSTLKAFYSVLKTCDECLRFSFLTGVTKFSKVSVFSDLNNLDDISRDVAYYDICGITETELHNELHTEVEAFSEELECSIEDAFAELKENYDGYRFSEKTKRLGKEIDGVYNPFSLLNALNKKTINNYWFETGTPTFLVEKLRTEHYEPKDLDGIVVSDSAMSISNKDELTLVQYLFQTGYLTIKDYDGEFRTYTLGYPNKEVRLGFVNCLLPLYAPKDVDTSEFGANHFVKALREGNIDGFMKRLQSFLSACPYEMLPQQERHVQNVIYLLSALCGYHTEFETHTNKGRIDLTIKTPKYIYIIELKYDQSAQEALAQIKEKGYVEPFAADERELICVGINYSSTERNINEWVVG